MDSLQEIRIGMPIIFGETSDRYPDSIHVVGTFLASSPITLCGAITGAVATPMIAILREKPSSYQPDTLFVLVVCPGSEESEYVGKTFSFVARKSIKERLPFGVHSENIFASNGVPFYWVRSSELFAVK